MPQRSPARSRSAPTARSSSSTGSASASARRLAAPDLSALGLHLLGGRLVPVGAAPGALLIYEDASGARLTWLIVRDPTDRTDTGFRYAERSGVGTFYWLDDGFGYALSAVMPRERLLDIATAVYDQI